MSKQSHVENIVAQMRSMKIYRPEFDILIEAMAQTLSMQDENVKQWKKDGFKQVMPYENKSGQINLVKSPYFDNYLKYNEQILKYGKSLGLSPADAHRLGVSLDDLKDDTSDFEM